MSARLGPWLLVSALALAPGLAAQKGRANEPSKCPWCHGDPALMQAAGIASHGGFKFGTKDTAWTDNFFASKDIYWIESQHFELGMTLSTQRITPDEAKKIRAELIELEQFLPDVDPKLRVLEPFMRVHLYALRVEKAWKRFQELMQVTDASFPDGNTIWMLGLPYWGEGPYMGQKGKFEVLLLPTPADQVYYLKHEFGLTIQRTQRWNVIDTSSLLVVTNLIENDLSDDQRIHNHLIFNIAINLLDGFKHYAYDTPCWLREGLAHFMEREINPRFNTFDASEGSLGVRVNKEKWDEEVKSMVISGKAPRVAELTALRTYAEFDMRDHYACWSMTKFMVQTNPAGYACLNGMLHGRKRADGMPDPEDLPGAQRTAFSECFNMSYAQFDDAWRAWAIEQ